jgi:hypothetical protein
MKRILAEALNLGSIIPRPNRRGEAVAGLMQIKVTQRPRFLERFHDLPQRPTTPARSGRAGSMVSRSPTSGNKPRHAGVGPASAL